MTTSNLGMLVPTNLWSLTASEVLKLTKGNKLTVEDYAKGLLSRIESRNGVVKAWQYFGTIINSLAANSFCLIL